MTSPPPRPELHVLVVAYGAPDDLQRCLEALGGRFVVTVVDNSSSATCRSVASTAGAAYVDPGRNLGFAAAVNFGLGMIGVPGPDVLLLNPDAVIGPDDLDVLHACLRAGPGVAAVAPRLVGLDGHAQRVCWPFPSPLRMWAEAVGLSRLTAESGFLVGAVLLLRSEAVADVGMFDDRFFLYAEETDWQRRAVDRGWQVLPCREAVALHRGAGTSDDAVLREARFHCAAETFMRKWHGNLGWQSYRAASVLGAVVRSVLAPADRRRRAQQRVKLYCQGPCRQLRSLTGPGAP